MTDAAPGLPWVLMPGRDPEDLHWRMGAGPDALADWEHWAGQTEPANRAAALLACGPVPEPWLDWAAGIVALPDDDDDALDAALDLLDPA